MRCRLQQFSHDIENADEFRSLAKALATLVIRRKECLKTKRIYTTKKTKDGGEAAKVSKTTKNWSAEKAAIGNPRVKTHWKK